jgi:hypothetical protein
LRSSGLLAKTNNGQRGQPAGRTTPARLKARPSAVWSPRCAARAGARPGRGGAAHMIAYSSSQCRMRSSTPSAVPSRPPYDLADGQATIALCMRYWTVSST